MNSSELRETLSEQIKLLKDGKGDPKTVNAIVNASGKILSTVKLEMAYAKMIGAPLASIPFMQQKKRLTKK